MIEFRGIHKSFRTPTSVKTLLRDFNLLLPAGAKVAIIGRNGAGKSTLLGMIAGTLLPNAGEIVRHGPVSWPLGFGGSFALDLTGPQNTRFVARIYGMDSDALVDYVQAFGEFGDFMDMPVRSYSAGMKARLAFGLSMGVSFDWYLVDEITAVGDAAFRKKSLGVFKGRLKDSGLLMVSHSPATLKEFCDCGIVLENGRAQFYEDIDEALSAHEQNLS